jgi:hypothetical protein
MADWNWNRFRGLCRRTAECHAASGALRANGQERSFLGRQEKGKFMKILIKGAMVAGLMALAACGGGGDDQAAENVEAATENQVENLEAAADNATNESTEASLENQAEAVEQAGENKADAIDDSDGAVDSNVSGM